jgi:hypothetical protein
VAWELGWAKTYDAEYVSLARILDASRLSGTNASAGERGGW